MLWLVANCFANCFSVYQIDLKTSPLAILMHSQRHHTPGTNLIEDAVETVLSDSSEQPQISKSQHFLRYWKLQFLAPIKSWRFPAECRKTAMYQSRWLATGHALLHLIPLSSAVAVLILNWSEHFVGPSFTFSTTLQFVAKLQELLMQASLAEIVLSIVRSQMMEGYLPLGCSVSIYTGDAPILPLVARFTGCSDIPVFPRAAESAIRLSSSSISPFDSPRWAVERCFVLFQGQECQADQVLYIGDPRATKTPCSLLD
ncbi:hypothetical protein BKA58DRAFT_74029 [Alternaria rosae]|uniref:uncharacterized protein n=1 Tax=Alternaria rosae TaxID=1187941 RepID=UPI001E8EF424|nr:uncharacterized protein BKA58DRAFT_74029 [Alternaria rosae]KAH6845922.1 hypothetical protein BKA58DRAFT_74029 [Alternaria rosae]